MQDTVYTFESMWHIPTYKYYTMRDIKRSAYEFHTQSLCWQPCLKMEIHDMEERSHVKIAVLQGCNTQECHTELQVPLCDCVQPYGRAASGNRHLKVKEAQLPTYNAVYLLCPLTRTCQQL
jgi:hypothetical protein